MSNDELIILSPLDQNIEVPNEDDILSKIEAMILQSIEEKDAKKAINICKQVYGIALLSGKALARILYLIKTNWHKFEIKDDFYDTMMSSTGLSKHTLQTYPAVYSMEAESKIPEKYQEEIMQKNMRDLVPIAQALDAGYEIEDDEWEELVDAPDFSTLNAKLRDIKGKEPRSHALILTMDRDGGIKALKNEQQFYVGWLNISEDNEVVQQAISRIKRGAGVLEQ